MLIYPINVLFFENTFCILYCRTMLLITAPLKTLQGILETVIAWKRHKAQCSLNMTAWWLCNTCLISSYNMERCVLLHERRMCLSCPITLTKALVTYPSKIANLSRILTQLRRILSGLFLLFKLFCKKVPSPRITLNKAFFSWNFKI